ncbi:unnamed protein product [Clonostachys rosea f. rosea IK726]|uniref:Uncharacterized protein n=2 Tax=Clonostachys rosea f. rosea IK726 TaxID=1349383 RepID=A0ACA9UJC5_BIOOC|nr:unnamed protein product [Clonostachys rosea f. rosea IK726]CAG9953505.1 unnamed protein product [Clonostachys rosea f. rosea IK726]
MKLAKEGLGQRGDTCIADKDIQETVICGDVKNNRLNRGTGGNIQLNDTDGNQRVITKYRQPSIIWYEELLERSLAHSKPMPLFAPEINGQYDEEIDMNVPFDLDSIV